MFKNFYENLLRSVGRVPDSDLKEMQKQNEKDRRYIKLGGDSDIEELPDEYFDDDEDEYFDNACDSPRKEFGVVEKDELVGNICFFSGLVIVSAFVVGAVVLIARVIAYPFVSRIVKDLDL